MKKAGFDVVVIGGGNAALCAALTAREKNARVMVIERAPEDKRGGNSAFTGGGFRMAYGGLEDIQKIVPDLSDEEIACTDFGHYTNEQYLDDLGRITKYHINPDLAEMIVLHSTETVRWIKDQGVRFLVNYGRHALKHNGRFKFLDGVVVYTNGGGRGLMDGLYRAVEKNGVEVRYNAEAVELVRGRDGVRAVRVLVGGEEEVVNARAVVLACGGFGANREWLARYIGPGWELAKVRGSRYNTGAGLRMALDIGAQPYGQWSGCHAVAWERYAPDFGDLDANFSPYRHSYPFGVMVNADGKRFVDEGGDFRNVTYAKYGNMVQKQPGSYAWQVFDAQVNHILREEYKLKGATKVVANTIEELAARMEDVDALQFVQTIKEYNAAVVQEIPFDPNVKDGRCTRGLELNKSNWATTLDVPPFVAYAVGCGVTFTFGGIKIDTSSRALDIADLPIPGLYAAGEMVGGLFYFNYPGGTGLMAGAVFGRVAGGGAADYALSRAFAN